MKIVGKQKIVGEIGISLLTPLEAYQESRKLMRQVERLNPWPQPRGFIFKAKTRESYEKWKGTQKNPWLW